MQPPTPDREIPLPFSVPLGLTRHRAGRLPHRRNAHARPAFTLVELLVVVAIIALLLGILLPALSKARRAAQASVCLSNMRNTAVATLMYTDNNDQQLPTVGLSHGTHHVDAQGSWLVLLESYSPNELLYRCPSDASPFFDDPPAGASRLRRVSYATNYYVSGQMVNWEPYGRLAKITRPATTIFAAELTEGPQADGSVSDFYGADHIHADQWIGVTDLETAAAKMVAHDRHAKGANYALLDGHAETLRLRKTFEIGAGSTPMKINWAANKYDPKVAR